MIRKVAYFSMQVPNRPGEGARMLKAIAKGKLNLLAFTGFPNAGRAQVDFVPANPGAFAKEAKKMGIRLGNRKSGTVRVYISSLLRKTDCTSRAEMVKSILERGRLG